ncbi:MAG: hypothetical protein IJ107_06115 [Lachnospiraceae bacterium]|nr:hypothetical protein [Lachnospiraceae bacterium]
MTDERPGNDFKYIIQDLYRLYFGAKCTYSEIMESDETYTRFKALCRNYLITEVDPDTTLESHFYHMSSSDRAAEVYTSLGARVRVNVPTVKKGLLGREQRVYKEEIWKIEDLMELSAQRKSFRGIVISEIQIPKRKLREFVI